MFFFLDANFVEYKVFESLLIQIKNLLSQKQVKEKNRRDKILDKKCVNLESKIEKKPRV